MLTVRINHKYQAWILEDAKLAKRSEATEGKFHQSDTCLNLVWAKIFIP